MDSQTQRIHNQHRRQSRPLRVLGKGPCALLGVSLPLLFSWGGHLVVGSMHFYPGHHTHPTKQGCNEKHICIVFTDSKYCGIYQRLLFNRHKANSFEIWAGEVDSKRAYRFQAVLVRAAVHHYVEDPTPHCLNKISYNCKKLQVYRPALSNELHQMIPILIRRSNEY